jgi:hypothetical protein
LSQDAHIELVEEVEQVSDLAGVKEPILKSLKNEEAYTTSLVVLTPASDSGVMTEPLFTKPLCSGLTVGEEIHLEGRTVTSENHDVGREAFLPQMHQTEVMEPMLAGSTSSKEGAEVIHGESIEEEESSAHNNGREEPISNREDQGDEWHSNELPYEEERCSEEDLFPADKEQQCIENSLMLGSDNVIHAISNNTQNKMIPTVEYDNKRYRHAYIVKLPKTLDGFMISIRKDLDDSPLLDEYYICFARYQRHKGDIMFRAEDLGVLQNVGDILVAINGEDIAGKKMPEVLKMIEPKVVGDVLELTFVDRVAFNKHSYKHLQTGNVSPKNGKIC